MELLVTCYKLSDIEKYKDQGADGFIVGGLFSTRFNFSNEDLKNISLFCKRHLLGFYVSVDALIFDSLKSELYDYLDFILSLDVDGIYFQDLSILDYCIDFNCVDKLIYDGDKLITNILDKQFYLFQGLKGVRIANELTYEELLGVLSKNPKGNDLIVGGYLQLSISKRRFIENYCKTTGLNINTINNNNLTIVEESRKYKMPIYENSYGTVVYSDFVLLMLEEYKEIKNYLSRAIIETRFLEEKVALDLVRTYSIIEIEDPIKMRNRLIDKYGSINFTCGFFYNEVEKNEE